MTTTKQEISILIGCADASLSKHLAKLLGRVPQVQVLSLASSWKNLVKKATSFEPDACLVDATLLRHAQATEIKNMRSTRWLGIGTKAQTVLADATLPLPGDAASEAAFLEACHQALGLAAPQAAANASGKRAASKPRCPPRNVRAIGIGVSTGGPQALDALIKELPADFPVPVLVVQHMPPNFTGSLARSLDEASAVKVSEAQDGETILAGQVYIAPGGFHMRVTGSPNNPRIKISSEAPVMACRPSVNVMFDSLRGVFGQDMVAVVMTGMGDDGLDACSKIHQQGGFVIAQDASTCTVYGMPRAIVENGLADEVVALGRLSNTLCHIVQP